MCAVTLFAVPVLGVPVLMNTIVSGPRVLLRAPCLFQVAVAEALLASGRADLAARFDAYVALLASTVRAVFYRPEARNCAMEATAHPVPVTGDRHVRLKVGEKCVRNCTFSFGSDTF